MHLMDRLAYQRPAAAPSNREVALWSRRQQPKLAAALFCMLALVVWAMTPRSSEAPPRIASVKLQTPVDAVPAEPVPQALVHFALNALLVPLLDDAVPPRWTDVVLKHICGPGTRVLIDGKPLEPYSVIPATAFSVHWTLDRCLPFGFESVELSGNVALQVFHEDNGLSAIVTPQGLRIDGSQGTSWLPGAFSAFMSLERPLRSGD